jgi:lipopolysaccharide transport system permease protein
MISALFTDWPLVAELTRRDLKSRYVGSTLGVTWAVLQPLFLILIFTVVFSVLARAEFVGAGFPGRWHYSVYLCAGLLPWIAVSEILSRSAGQFLELANLIKKIAFRKAVLLWSVGIASWVTFLIAAALFFMFLALIGHFHVGPLLCYMVISVLFLVFGVGLGAGAASLTAYLRDVKHIVTVGTQLWFWATPIVWVASERMPGWLLRAEQFNPVYWYVHPMQELIVWSGYPAAGEWFLMVGGTAASLIFGGAALRLVEPHLADQL